MLRILFASMMLMALISCSSEEETLKIKRDIANVQEQIYEIEGKQEQMRAEISDRLKVLERKLEDRTAVADTQDQLHRVKQELSEYQALMHDLENKIAELQANNSRVSLAVEREPDAEGGSANSEVSEDNPLNPATQPVAEVSGDVVQNQLRQAQLDYNRGKYEVAIEGFRDILNNFPNSPYTEKAMYYLGSSLYQKEQYQEAREVFSKISETYPDGKFMKQSLYYEGRCFYNLGQLSKAILAMRELKEKHPDTQEAQLADNFLKQSGYER